MDFYVSIVVLTVIYTRIPIVLFICSGVGRGMKKKIGKILRYARKSIVYYTSDCECRCECILTVKLPQLPCVEWGVYVCMYVCMHEWLWSYEYGHLSYSNYLHICIHQAIYIHMPGPLYLSRMVVVCDSIHEIMWCWNFLKCTMRYHNGFAWWSIEIGYCITSTITTVTTPWSQSLSTVNRQVRR